MNHVSFINLLFFIFLSSCGARFIYFLPQEGTSILPSTSQPSLSISSLSIQEHGVATVTVSLSNLSSSDVTFNYSTQDLTAVAGQQYMAVSGVSTILAGTSATVISVPINDNNFLALNTVFNLNISAATNATVSAGTAAVQILEDDLDYLENVVSIAGNMFHYCALKNDGSVYCWGNNFNLQLGDMTSNDRSAAVLASSLGLPASAVFVHNYASCAILNDNTVKCWGQNTYGELGNGTTVDSNPTLVTGLSNVNEIYMANSRTCALLNTGALKCWGFGLGGQLGQGAANSSATAVDPVGLSSGVSKLAMSNSEACALMTNGNIKCWGANNTGAIGDGTTIQRNSPTNVLVISGDATNVVAGYSNFCALTTSDGVKCWGSGTNGQLGNGFAANSSSPVDVSGLTSGVSSIYSLGGGDTFCAILNTGAIKCWGSGNNGLLGNGFSINSSTPVDVLGISSNAISIFSNGSSACSNLAGGGLKCWGTAYNGVLGHGLLTNSSSIPVVVSQISTDVSSVAVGSLSACALINSGEVKCWGTGYAGEVGRGLFNYHSRVIDSEAASIDVSVLSSGYNFNCALTNAGGVKCWGYNNHGHLGNGVAGYKERTAQNVVGLSSGVSKLSSGYNHSCAIQGANVKCWGENWNGQLGDGTTIHSSTPVTVLGLGATITKLALGDSSSCALTSGGGVKCWGANWSGELGNGTTTNSLSPVDVIGLNSGVTDIYAGEGFYCALLNTGSARCWGAGSSGQLGQGIAADSSTPVNVLLVGTITQMALGDYHSCALLNTGIVNCWGANWYGQLGNGSTTDSLSPVTVIASDIAVEISSGLGEHNCIRNNTGGVKCWGGNWEGQLGDGTRNERSLPTQVLNLNSGVESLISGYDHNCALLSSGPVKCWGNNEEEQLGSKYNTLLPDFVISN